MSRKCLIIKIKVYFSTLTVISKPFFFSDFEPLTKCPIETLIGEWEMGDK